MDNFGVVGAQGVQQAKSNNSLVDGCGQSSPIEAKAEISARPAPLRKRETGYVYFITDGDAIKIGFSIDVGFRCGELQTANPRPLTVIASFAGTRSDEGELHRKFRTHRIAGEWFRPDKEITAFIAWAEFMKAQLWAWKATMTRLLDGSAEQDLLRQHAEARAYQTVKAMAAWLAARPTPQDEKGRRLFRFCERSLESVGINLKHQNERAVVLTLKFAGEDFARLNAHQPASVL